VVADRVVLAANGANGALHPAMRGTVAPLHVTEFATAPLSAEERQKVLPSGEAFTDRQAYVFTARYDAAGRLISAFPRTLAVRGGAALEAEALRRLRRNFPGLRQPRIEHLWSGTAWLSPALRPQLHDLGEGAYAIQACNGRGLPTNLMLGAELANVLVTGKSDALSVPFEPPKPMHLHFLAKHAPLALMTLAYARSRWRGGRQELPTASA
jgi:glycine/D-amino acid oxidase-like deaminating enzyme